MYACTYIYMHAIKINEKRGYKFEGEWGGLYKRVWREERERRNVIILQSQKLK